MKIVKEMPKTGKFLSIYIDMLDGEMCTNLWAWEDGVLKDWDYRMEDYYPVVMSYYPDNLYYIVADSEWNEEEERALFEKTYEIQEGVEFIQEFNGGKGGYAIYIEPTYGEPKWTNCNAAFHVQRDWEVWKACSKAHYEVTK